MDLSNLKIHENTDIVEDELNVAWFCLFLLEHPGRQ